MTLNASGGHNNGCSGLCDHQQETSGNYLSNETQTVYRGSQSRNFKFLSGATQVQKKGNFIYGTGVLRCPEKGNKMTITTHMVTNQELKQNIFTIQGTPENG